MTLARELNKDHRLAASFFFDKRATQDTSSALNMFISTLARQISKFDSRYHQALASVLMENPDVVKDNLEVQADKLLITPLSVLYPTPSDSSSETPAVIILDALDECGSLDDLNTVLRVLGLLNSLPRNYRIFLTSRPHPAVLQQFPFHSTGVEDLDDPRYQTSAGDDILRFIETEFNSREFNRAEDPNWPPSGEEVEDFSALSQGLFELAALRVRRIKSGPSIGLPFKTVFDSIKNEATGLPAKRLEMELEKEYLRILDWVYPSDHPDLHHAIQPYRLIVGTFVSLRHPLSLDAMCKILEMDDFAFRTALDPLSSVFCVDADPYIPIRCYHATFREFLLAIPPLSTEFHRMFLFDGPQHSLMLRLCVGQLLLLSLELRTGPCAETNDYDFLDDIPDFDVKVGVLLPSHVRYCCLEWSYHLLLTSTDEVVAVESTLAALIQTCLLNWIEAMSLLRETNEALSILVRTSEWYRSRRVRCSLKPT